jgi:hypothetical protein
MLLYPACFILCQHLGDATPRSQQSAFGKWANVVDVLEDLGVKPPLALAATELLLL